MDTFTTAYSFSVISHGLHQRMMLGRDILYLIVFLCNLCAIKDERLEPPTKIKKCKGPNKRKIKINTNGHVTITSGRKRESRLKKIGT